MNCREFKKCRREPNGKNITLYGVCPVTTASNADGIHNGKNGGRCCWAIIPAPDDEMKNTLDYCCGGLSECIRCDFYQHVKESTELVISV